LSVVLNNLNELALGCNQAWLNSRQSRTHGAEFSSILILKHQHGLVTDCHQLPIAPIVLKSAPIMSVAN